MEKIVIRKPFDAHVHLRQGDMLKNVAGCTADVFFGGVAMGNLPKPIVTAEDAMNYRNEILEAAPGFNPVMTVMLTKQTTCEILENAFNAGVRVLKYIPGNASTNSNDGVPLENLELYYDVLRTAERSGMVFSGRWELPCEVNGKDIPEIQRESRAIDYLKKVVRKFPALRIVVEHATTHEMIEYVKKAPDNVAATLTVHHAMLTYTKVCNRKDEVKDPFNYCKPIAKTANDRKAVVRAMVSGNPKFFFGSDSAPHDLQKKTAIPPAAGIFTAPVVLPLFCQIFEKRGLLCRLENFVSVFGPEFYGIPASKEKIVLIKSDCDYPEFVGDVKVFHGGEILNWKVLKS